MITSREMRDLPSDPIEAFLKLEETAREKFDQSDGQQLARMQYMNAVITIAQTLGLDFLSGFKYPANDDVSMYQFSQKYDNLLLTVDRFLLAHRMDRTNRDKQFSVVLDPPTKSKIRHYIAQIKEVVDHLDLPQSKKEAIYNRINALSSEVDRARTRFEVLMGAVLIAADTGGKAGRALAPVRRLLNPIIRLLSEAKEAEELLSLPAPDEVKRLPAPRRARRGVSKSSDNERTT
jgi:hypothetical protein